MAHEETIPSKQDKLHLEILELAERNAGFVYGIITDLNGPRISEKPLEERRAEISSYYVDLCIDETKSGNLIYLGDSDNKDIVFGTAVSGWFDRLAESGSEIMNPTITNDMLEGMIEEYSKQKWLNRKAPAKRVVDAMLTARTIVPKESSNVELSKAKFASKVSTIRNAEKRERHRRAVLIGSVATIGTLYGINRHNSSQSQPFTTE